MSARICANRVNRKTTADPSPCASDGGNAVAIAPPNYGIDFVDQAASATATVQRMGQPVPNATGMPDRLKAGLELLSSMNLSDVRVHPNSDRPARLDALAYAQA